MHFELDDQQDTQITPESQVTQPVNSPQINNPPLPSSITEIIDPQPVDVTSKEEKELKVPQIIKTNYNLQHYNPEIMQKIILDIATTNDPIDDIILRHGQKKTTVYLWRSLSVQLLNAWRTAKRHRTHVISDEFESDVARLDDKVEHDDDFRRNNNRIRLFDRVWGHREWSMSRHNRQDYGDKVEVDNNLTISPAKLRDEAYIAHNGDSSPVDAEYEDITVPPTLNQADIDTGQSQ